MNKTKIVCTIGPACSDIEIIKDMIRAGMDVARFNMSHGTHESHKELIDLVKQARYEMGVPVAIMLDTKGPEIRIRQFKDGSVMLKKGQDFALTTEYVIGDSSIVSVTYEKLPSILKKGTKILLNDGLIELKVTSISGKIIYTRVVNGGELSNNKSINIPSVELNMNYLGDVDKKDLEFGVEQGVDAYAISFVNSDDDVKTVRKYLEKLGEREAFIISKIESSKGVERMEKIIAASDGVMIARGDMGVEIAFEKLPQIQKKIIEVANGLGKYTITATQMLESMVSNPRPTRAEISDVANAIYDGSAAIMLSGETSAGKYPVESVSTMNKIASEAEDSIELEKELVKNIPTKSITCAVGYAACTLASSLNAKAILVTTNSGTSAACISRFRPTCKIVALTPNLKTYYRLAMLWGVNPLLERTYYNTDELLASAKEQAKKFKHVKKGDIVVQTAGIMTGATGSDMLVVSEIE